jgi:hypothetical protein
MDASAGASVGASFCRFDVLYGTRIGEGRPARFIEEHIARRFAWLLYAFA